VFSFTFADVSVVLFQPFSEKVATQIPPAIFFPVFPQALDNDLQVRSQNLSSQSFIASAQSFCFESSLRAIPLHRRDHWYVAFFPDRAPFSFSHSAGSFFFLRLDGQMSGVRHLGRSPSTFLVLRPKFHTAQRAFFDSFNGKHSFYQKQGVFILLFPFWLLERLSPPAGRMADFSSLSAGFLLVS